ncbi:hypothetical protein M9H77_16012 [Catharanthus roseus]|uniref:Uncharacterized protein n=1 Tax=Catharanthus roseus TaxID=4058 RepID=A0ACC0AZ42_CATRO|nr:hypothetical protein M9H77_16012 [Catharanthus roseus]
MSYGLGLIKRRLDLISWVEMSDGSVHPGLSKVAVALILDSNLLFLFSSPLLFFIAELRLALKDLHFQLSCSFLFTGAANRSQLTARPTTTVRRRESRKRRRKRVAFFLCEVVHFLRDRCFFNISGRPIFLEDRPISTAAYSTMKTVLVQHKIAPAICSPDKYLESWKGEILAEKLGDAHSCLTLHLTNNVLREIDEKDNAFEIWAKLEKTLFGKVLVK